MVIFPNAKINIGLYIIEKRKDGFHNLESIFCPIGLTDILEFVENKTGNDDELEVTGIPVNVPMEKNIVYKALLKMREFAKIPFLKMHLHKCIPNGAGLGGGSADAAFFLKALNEYFDIKLSDKKLKEIAAELGSDCAFFISNQPAFATGRGELLHPVQLNLKGWYCTLVKPECHCNTAKAYSLIRPQKPTVDLTKAIKRPVPEWKDAIGNDFEAPIFSMFPEIGQIKERLYGIGAEYACMSGSGSSVFALSRKCLGAASDFSGCFYADILLGKY